MPGTIHVIETSLQTIHLRVSGSFDLVLCSEVTGVLDRWMGSRTGISIFADAGGVEDYEVVARERLSGWLTEHKAAFDALHVRVDGRTIAWAIDIIGTVTGMKIVSHHSSEAFQAAYAAHVAGKRS